MWEREATDHIKDAVTQLFPSCRDAVLACLLDATAEERVHADILVLSFGDRIKLEQLAQVAKDDSRDIMMCEYHPEDFLNVPNRSTAAAELARRFKVLNLPVPDAVAQWAQWA